MSNARKTPQNDTWNGHVPVLMIPELPHLLYGIYLRHLPTASTYRNNQGHLPTGPTNRKMRLRHRLGNDRAVKRPVLVDFLKTVGDMLISSA